MANSRLLEYNQLLCAFSSLPTTIISESQIYLKNTEETQFSYDTGLSSRELEDAIRCKVLRTRLMGQVNMSDADISLDQLRMEGLRRWNMDIEYLINQNI